ncbi:glycosyltransferase family 2 protein [Bradyrhizobium murdochi]|uniref:glycosyltransferase family 2 protein n=1 Tax=Bradyrhizobium murdochi TaxID=1038859 RepID=UPI000416CD2E|nr:glycosyltransferase family A protein [Bradyrhizobium murdochi]
MSMRNSASTVADAIRSVQLQALQDWEMIVVDDGSSDQSGAIVEGFGDERIRIVREHCSAGLALRLNQAVALSRGEFIARMDADDICFPDRLVHQIERLQRDPQIDLLGCGAVVFTSSGELIGEMPIGRTHQDIIARPFVGFPLPHPTWCGRTAWFRRHPYDSKPTYAEDQDLLLRNFRHSKFAGLDTILLGYRQDRLTLRKLLPGRAALIGASWRYGLREGKILPALAGIAGHVIKGAVDVATVGSGINRPMQRKRLRPVSHSTMRRWKSVQEHLNSL